MTRSHLKALCAFAPHSLYVNYNQLSSQLNNLSIDINMIEIILWIIIWRCGKLKNYFFHQHFLNGDKSLHRHKKLLKFCLCVLQYHIEGTVSQNFYLGLSFCFMKSRKNKFQEMIKSYPFFTIKTKLSPISKI